MTLAPGGGARAADRRPSGYEVSASGLRRFYASAMALLRKDHREADLEQLIRRVAPAFDLNPSPERADTGSRFDIKPYSVVRDQSTDSIEAHVPSRNLPCPA